MSEQIWWNAPIFVDWYTYLIFLKGMGSYAIPNQKLFSKFYYFKVFLLLITFLPPTSQYPYPHMPIYHKVWKFRWQLLFFKLLIAKQPTVMYDSHNLSAVTKHTSIKRCILSSKRHVVNPHQGYFIFRKKNPLWLIQYFVSLWTLLLHKSGQ